jgi:hypothetical protein
VAKSCGDESINRANTYSPRFAPTATNNLAWVFIRAHRYADAEKLDREVLEVERQTLGPTHASTLLMGNFGFALIAEKNWSEAEKLLRKNLLACTVFSVLPAWSRG